MAEAKFDPYHAWLGIPAWDRPVNAYRLLGVEVFEQNRKVIEAAANRQMAYLQELSAGDEHIEEAQKMLGLVSRARVLLLNPGKKTAYDKKLTAQLDSLPEAEGETNTTEAFQTRRPTAAPMTKKDKNNNFWEKVRIGLVAVVGMLAILVAVLSMPTKPLSVFVYRDKNQNNQFDPDEEAERLEVDEVLGKDDLPRAGFPTDREGMVYLDLESGTYDLTVGGESRYRYEIIGGKNEPTKNDGEPYVEVDVAGSRFFKQRIEIPVRKKEKPKRVVKKTPPQDSNSQGSASARITIIGHIYTLDAEGKPQGWEEDLYFDLDGNGIFGNGKEPFLEPNAEGKFEITFPRKAIQSKTVLRLMKSPNNYQDPGGIPLSIADAKNGVLQVDTELKRKLMSIQGTLSMLPEGESLEGFVVYMDRNQNDQPDDNEPQTKTAADGNYQWEFQHFNEDVPEILKIQVSPDTYLPYRRLPGATLNNKKLTITIKDANFKIIKKSALNDGATTEQTTVTEGGLTEIGKEGPKEDKTPTLVPDPAEDPKGYLMHIGYLPLPEDDKTWRLYDPDAATGFIKAKGVFVKARKKGNWDQRLQELGAKIDARQAEADQYGADAGKKSKKGPQAKAEAKAKRDAILTQIGKWQEEQGKIQAEKERFLSDIRDNLSILTSNSQNYQRAEADENCEKAAQAAGIELMPVPVKHRKTWETANRFDAELALEEQFGLTAIGKGKNKTWSLQSLATIKSKEQQFNQIYTQFRASGYLQLKQQQDKLIEELKFDTPEARQVKSKLQQMERNPRFKEGIAQLKTSAKSFFDALNQAILQIAQVREKEEQIKTYFERTGGNYKKFIETLPDDKSLDTQLEKVQTVLALLPA